MIDNSFFKNYSRILRRINDLRDCCVLFTDDKGNVRRDRFHNDELEHFRNHPKEPYVERNVDRRFNVRIYRGSFQPRLQALTEHCVNQTTSTIWMTNSGSKDVLLMLGDIDNKAGEGDADRAARHLSTRYLGDQSFIEHSTGGLGRHVYFLLDIRRSDARLAYCRDDVHDIVKKMAERVKADPVFADCGVTFDAFYGLPTLWRKTEGVWEIQQRGDCLKLPYLSFGTPDLTKLLALKRRKLQEWLIVVSNSASLVEGREYLPSHPSAPAGLGPAGPNIGGSIPEDEKRGTAESGQVVPVATIGKDYLGVTTPKTSKLPVDPATITDGFIKKKMCCDLCLQKSNGTCAADDVITEYHANWLPKDMSVGGIKKRSKVITRIFNARLKTFKPSTSHPHSFKRDEYLNRVTKLVPDQVFVWNRREKINHRRLADFLSIKIQDCFYDPDKRQRAGFFATTTRNMTVNNSRALKTKGLIDWCLNSHTYKKLMEVAVQYGLLEIVKEHVKPSHGKEGRGTMLAPGNALQELKAEWLELYQKNGK